MGDHSKIEWTDASWNPVRARNLATGGIGHFCIHASEGCRNCYAERLQPRFGNPIRFAAQDRDKVEIFLDEKMLTQPLRWKRPRRIFVGSMTDLFADFVTDDMLDRIFAVMALCPQHTFQMLTKRPARMRTYLTDDDLNDRLSAALGNMLDGDWIWNEGKRFRPTIERRISEFLGEDTTDDGLIERSDDPMPLPNVWLGVSVEDQATADERIPLLLETPASVRFLSYEPALGPIILAPLADRSYRMLSKYYGPEGFDETGSQPARARMSGLFPKLDWIICGGESGPGARPMHPDWARSVRDQCAAAGVPFFFKQWGEWLEIDGPRCRAVFGDRRDGDSWILPDGALLDRKHTGKCSVYQTPLVRRVGRQLAGRLLDGIEHNDLPSATKGTQS